MLDAAILNVLITTVDSHAKNYSILIDNGGARLAPLYDLMCGSARDDITKNMAQKSVASAGVGICIGGIGKGWRKPAGSTSG